MKSKSTNHKSARKTFVLDTNVIVHDPLAPWNFQDNIVLIPLPVLSELDSLKTKDGAVGASVRDANRRLYEAVNKNPKGVIPTKKGGEIRFVEIPCECKNSQLGGKAYTDNLLLEFVQQNKGYILVTKDVAMSLKGHALGINVQDYTTDKTEAEEDARVFHMPSSGNIISDDGILKIRNSKGKINEYAILRQPDYEEIPVRCTGKDTYKILPSYAAFLNGNPNAGITLPRGKKVLPRNPEQWMLMDAIKNPKIKLVTAIGKAGTGKTFIALATAIQEAIERKHYEKIYITRPIVQMGKDLGALPGTMEEKINPYLQPYFDNLGEIFKEKEAYRKYLNSGEITVEALTYIRGRSLSNVLMIVDEAQNLTPHEAKTIITRMGKDSKLVLLGDPTQIDSPYLDRHSNGLVYTFSKLRNFDITANIKLVHGERSELAELAANEL